MEIQQHTHTHTFSQCYHHKHRCPENSPDFSWEVKNVSDHKSEHTHIHTPTPLSPGSVVVVVSWVVRHNSWQPTNHIFSLLSDPHPPSTARPPAWLKHTLVNDTDAHTLTRGWLLSRGLRGSEWKKNGWQNLTAARTLFFFSFPVSLSLSQPQQRWFVEFVLHGRKVVKSGLLTGRVCSVRKCKSTYRPWTEAHSICKRKQWEGGSSSDF